MKMSPFAAAFFIAAVVLGVLISGDPEMREPAAYVMVGVLITCGVAVAWFESWKR